MKKFIRNSIVLYFAGVGYICHPYFTRTVKEGLRITLAKRGHTSFREYLNEGPKDPII